MKVSDLNRSVQNVKKLKPILDKGSKGSLKDLLSAMSNIIEKFEKDGGSDSKDDKDKIMVLKNIISDMIEDTAQKNIIRGGV